MKKSFLIAPIAALILASCAGDTGNYPDGLPKALRTEPKDGPMPEYIYDVDSTTINITFLGEKPEPGSTLDAFLVSSAEYAEVPGVSLDSTGTATLRVPVLGTSVLSINLNDFEKRYGEAWIKPGETTNIYIDNRPDSIRGEGRTIYSDGFYSNLTAMMGKYPERHVINNYSFTDVNIGDYSTPGDVYVKNLAVAYADSLKAIDADTIPDMVKAMSRASLKAGILSMLQVDFINRGTWYMAHMDGKPLDADSVVLAISPENVKTVYEIADFNDKSMLMSPILNLVLNGTDFSAGGEVSNYLTELQQYQKIASKAASGLLNDERLATLASMSDAEFYTKVAKFLDAGYQAKFEETSKLISQLPADLPGDKIIETIADAHKGKVVVIDLWNTWCGPCKAAIAANEPVKATELTDPDIVWVYIADESSPMNLYINMIPNIKGEHYHISQDQAMALHKQFKVDGIPYYITVDRKGNIEGRPELRDHDLYKATILTKLQE